MKPFDLEKALAGHPLVTRDGRKVLDFHYFKVMTQYRFPIYAAIENIGGSYPYFTQFDIEGSEHSGIEESQNDLFLASTKKTYWMNIYKDWNGSIILGGNLFESMEEAIDSAKYRHEKIKTISFEVEE